MNCSGKHAAMLATCVANGWPLDDLPRPRPPAAAGSSRATVARLAGEPVAATGVDGCGAPVFALTLAGLARAFVAIATAAPGTPEHRVAEAIRQHPEWLGGTRRDVTALVAASPAWSPRTAPRASTPPRCPTAGRSPSRSRTAASAPGPR